MANKYRNALASFGSTPNHTTPAADTPEVVEKKAQVEMSSKAKIAAFGSNQQRNTAATARIQGNEQGEDLDTWAIQNLSDPLAIEAIAPGGLQARQNLYEAEQSVYDLKQAERPMGDVVKDAAIDTGLMAANTAGGAAAFGAAAVDQATGGNSAGEIAQGLSWLNEQGRGAQSELRQKRAAQHELEGRLASEENEAQYQREIQETGEDAWAPWLRKQGKNFVDAASNYADDPIMAGSLAPEAVGSLLPATAGIKAIAAARAAKIAAARNIATDSAEYASLVAREGEKVAPFVMAATESGAGINETQQRIFAMSEEELSESEDYQQLRAQGMTHEEAQSEFAKQRGAATGVRSLPGALAAGRVSASFAANPLSAGTKGSRLTGAVTKTGSEALEETLQEANTAANTNISLDQGGIETDWDEGVAEQAAQGALGGLAMAGTLQAPGAVAGAAQDAAQGTADAAKAGVRRANERADRARADASTVGEADTNERLDAIDNQMGEVVEAAAEPVETEAEGEAPAAEADTSDENVRKIAEKIRTAAVLDPEDAAFKSKFYNGAVNREGTDTVRRRDVLRVAHNALTKSETLEDGDKAQIAMDVIESFRALQALDSDEINATAQALPEDHKARQGHQKITELMQEVEESGTLQMAQDALRELTPESVNEMFRQYAEDKTQDPSVRKEYARAVKMIAEVNPEIVEVEHFDQAMDQMNPQRRKGLETLKEVSSILRDSRQEKERINEDQTKAKSLGNLGSGYTHRTSDGVRSDIETEGNQQRDKGYSLDDHRDRIMSSMEIGRVSEAETSLENLGEFARSMGNKIEALNKSVRTGKPQTYQAYNPDTGTWFESPKVGVSLDSPGRIAYAEEVQADAQSITRMYNTMRDGYADRMENPGETINAPRLDRKIRQKHRRNEGTPQPKQADTATGMPADESVDTSEADSVREWAENASQRKEKPKRKPAGNRRELEKAAGGRKPFTEFLKGQGGIKPGSTLAKELKAAGIQSKDARGLVRSGGTLAEADQISTEETNIADLYGVEDDGRTMSLSAVVDAIREEIAGNPQPVTNDQATAQTDLAEFDTAQSEYERTRPATTPTQTTPQDDAAETGEAGQAAEAEQQVEENADVVAEETPSEDSEGAAEAREEPTEAGDGASETSGEAVRDEAEPAEAEDGDSADEGSADVEVEDVVNEADDPVTAWFNASKELLIAAKDTVNGFIESYRPRKGKSTLTLYERPTDHILDSDEFSPEERDSLDVLLGSTYESFSSDFNERLLKELDKKNGKGRRYLDAMLEDGQNVAGFAKFLPANFLQETDDGGYEISPQVMAATYMATQEWVMQNMNGQRRVDDDDINDLFEQKRGGQVTSEMRQVAQFGTQSYLVTNQIAKSIERLLGVAPKDDAAIRYTQGLMRAMASNAMQLMIEDGTLEVNVDAQPAVWKNKKLVREGDKTPVAWSMPEGADALRDVGQNFKVGDKTRRFTMIRVGEGIKDEDGYRGLKGRRDVFTSQFVAEGGRDRYVGTKPPKPSTTQLGNELAENSELEQKAQKVLQKQQVFGNAPMVGLLDALGDQTWKRLMGYKELSDFDKRGMNKAQVVTQEGINQGLDRGILETRGYITEMQTKAKDGAWDRVPAYFPWEISSVGRLQQMGPITPQGDKTAREMLVHTRTTLDLSDPDGEHMEAMWLALAQSLDIKIEAMTPQQARAKAEEKLRGELKPALDLLIQFEQTGALDGEAFTDALAQSGEEVNPKLIHALLTKARMDTATDLKKFETALAIEADGKTDGPINAMVHMTTGEFTKGQIENLAKGGVLFTDQQMSLDQYLQSYDKEDLYEKAATQFNGALAEHLKTQGGDALSTISFLDRFLPHFSDLGVNEKGERKFEIKRNITKNPLTIFLYGSGQDGIAGNIASAAMERVNKLLGEVATAVRDGNKPADVIEDYTEKLGALRGVFSKQEVRKMLEDPAGFELSKDQFEALQGRVREGFSDVMLEAINDVTGGLQTNMELNQNTATAQTLLFQHALDQKLAEAKDKKERDLTQNEIMDVFRDTMKQAPIFDTDAQSFHISAPKPKPAEGQEISETINGQLGTAPTLVTGADASVKVSPFMTIGTGDARMMLNIYTSGDDTLKSSLAVFDGVELTVDGAGQASSTINKASWNGWMDSNVYRSLANGFEQLSAIITPEMLNNLTGDTRWKVENAMKSSQGDKRKLSVEMFADRQKQLEKFADESEARKRAMGRMASSTDHMAGMKRPHNRSGETIENSNPYHHEAIAAKLNTLYREELDKIRQERQDKRAEPAVQGATTALSEAVESIGELLPGGVRKVQGDALLTFLSHAKEATKEQQDIAKQLMRQKTGAMKSTFYFGDTDALADIELEAIGRNGHQDYLGRSYPVRGLALIANASPETVLHEALHIQTTKALETYVETPQSAPAHVREAGRNIERLMKEMAAAGVPNDDTAEAWMEGMRQVQEAPDRVAKMGEFVSWMLSNQKLIAAGQKRKAQTKRSPLARIVKGGWDALMQMLGIEAKPGNTVFSNLAFNTEVLTSNHQQIRGQMLEAEARAKRHFDQQSPGDTRLPWIEEAYGKRLQAMTAAATTNRERSQQLKELSRRQRLAQDAITAAQQSGFHLNDRQAMAFEMVHTVIMSGANLDATLLRRANDQLSHVIDTLTVEDLTAQGVPAAEAQKRVEFITEAGKGRKGRDGRTDVLATFMALSQVDPAMRKALADKTPPKRAKIKADSLDGILRNIAQAAVDLIMTLSLQQRPTKTVSHELDIVAEGLSRVGAKRRHIAALETASEKVEWANRKGAEALNRSSTETARKLRKQALSMDNSQRAKRATFKTGAFVTALGSKEESAVSAKSALSQLNELPGMHVARGLLNDIVGMNEDNKGLLRLINPAKAQIDAVRQDSREGIPRELAARFSRELDRAEWEALYTGIAQADLAAIGRDDAEGLMADTSSLQQRIEAAEGEVKRLGGKKAKLYMARAKALGTYMTTRKVISKHLQRNAQAIVTEAGEGNAKFDQQTHDAVDKLISLYAFEAMPQETQAKIQELMTSEQDAISTITGVTEKARKMELERVRGDTRAQLNGWKGYVPSVPLRGSGLIVADDRDSKELQLKGWERVGDYKGERSDRGKRGYYRSVVANTTPYRQGVAQTVTESYQGVDNRTGMTRGNETSGLIQGPEARRIQKRLSREFMDDLEDGEYLLPIFDENGNLAGYERSLSAEMLDTVPQDKHLGRMLGNWMGRIAEESIADEFNNKLINVLKMDYDKAKEAGETAEFVNVADADDPIIKDAWKSLGWRMKDDLQSSFERKFVPVRRNHVEDALGYRAASVTDAWTGMSRWNDKTRKEVRDLATVVLGKDAYKRMAQGEQFVGDVVSYAKETIIVRSIKVAVDNIASNFLDLALMGVPVWELPKRMRQKFIETTEFTKNQEKRQKLNVARERAYNDPKEQKRIDAQIQALDEADSRMSIAPLIEAGEFSTISEGLDEADLAMKDGRIANWISAKVDAAEERVNRTLPKWTTDAVKTAAITKDTALYQGLNRMIQYGDFLAKAVLYDHLKGKGMEERAVLDKIQERYVQYNRLPGRARDAAESVGMLWFWNYKLRIAKIAAESIRERPFSSLVMMGGVGPGLDMDTVWDGSIMGTMADGSVSYSVGPEMGFNAFAMNPFVDALH